MPIACTIPPPRAEERIVLIGTNGSGKSKMAEKLLGAWTGPAVYLDPKGDFTPPGPATVIHKPFGSAWTFHAKGRIVYRPDPDYLNGPSWRGLFRMLWERARREGKKRPFLLYVDEAQYIAQQGAQRELANLAITTRSLGMGLICASQRPKWVPVEIRTEAWRWYVFYLTYDDDKKEVAAYTSGRLTAEDLDRDGDPFSFWEIRREGQHPSKLAIHHCKPVRV